MHPTAQDPSGNLPELSVSEISFALKRTVEDAFSYVRVRGEISGFKRAASGHLYMALKDDKAVLDGVCWRGTAGRLSIRPEDGMEVVVTGKLTTYPGRSKYQIVIESMELAGEGALLKLLEERRRKLLAEGLFEADRKQELPFLPRVIGVVTSPTGAVIRDILHRLEDRFPTHVLLWPVMVQGDGAADQVAAAIRGFNAIAPGGAVPRPDLLIVARGGGSLEDLWAFNEEAVVRAAADSEIPLISAVGHETDTTLIDFASDRRAPTPTAAAEMAVPVRRDLFADLVSLDQRAGNAVNKMIATGSMRVEGLSRGLPDPASLIGQHQQRVDDLGDRLAGRMRGIIRDRGRESLQLGARLRSPRQVLAQRADRLADLSGRLTQQGGRAVAQSARRYEQSRAGERLSNALRRRVREGGQRLDQLARRLESVSYVNVLRRGFALVRDEDGAVVKSAAALRAGQAVTLTLADGEAGAVIDGRGPDGDPPAQPRPRTKAARTSQAKAMPVDPPQQGKLL